MLHFKKITTIEEAKSYWELFSQNVELYDDWMFRFLYWEFTKEEILFIVGMENDQPIGLLPLQWNNDGYYEFFGGSFMSYNCLFIREDYKKFEHKFLEQIEKPAYLRWMKSPIGHPLLNTSEKSTYFLPLEGLTSIDDYFQKSVSKTRGKQLGKEMRKIIREGAVLKENNNDHLDLLAHYNKEKFGENSVFNQPYRVEFLHKVLTHFNCNILTIVVAGEIQAIGLRVMYNDTIYGINTGVKEGTSNLGKFLYLKAIELGIKNKCKKYDALEGAYGWKEEFGFLPRTQYHLDLRNQ